MAGAGYKLFNTGDVLLASEVNTYLMQQTVMIFDDASARTTALSGVVAEGMISYLKDTDAVEKYDGSSWVSLAGAASPLTTKGDLYTYSTTDARLPVGTDGYTLVADSTEATGLKWATPAGGKVLQVIQATYATTTTVASTTFTDTGLSASITPSSTNSKVLVLVNQTINVFRSVAGIGMGHRLLRGSTTIYDPAPNKTESLYTSGTNLHSVGNIIYLDSPSTTSSTTYKTQIACNTTADSGQCSSSPASGTSTIILMEIGA